MWERWPILGIRSWMRETGGNVLKRHGIAPAPKRSQTTTGKEFIQSHMAVLAGIDFFRVEVLTWRGLTNPAGVVPKSFPGACRLLIQ